MTVAPALIPSPNTTTDVGQADRALLSSLKVAVSGVSTELCRRMVGEVLSVQHHRLGSLLRAAAVRGLDADSAARVEAQIDAALQAKPSASFPGLEVKTARTDTGAVEFRCEVDYAAIDVTLEGGGYRAGPSPDAEPREPQPRHFVATVTGIPSPTLVLPQPQMIVNAGPQPTKQVVERDEDGEIKTISTVLQ